MFGHKNLAFTSLPSSWESPSPWKACKILIKLGSRQASIPYQTFWEQSLCCKCNFGVTASPPKKSKASLRHNGYMDMRKTCSTRKKSQDSSNYKNLKSLKKTMSLNILAKGIHTLMMLTKTLLPKKFKPPYTLSIGYGKCIQNKNTWLSRSRRWMSLNFSFHQDRFNL